MARQLDVVTVGRSSVDLYGEQVGGRLEDMASFAKYVGGCPTNIAVGTARLGLRSALITRVGDEHMGRFIKEQCAREGVDVQRRRHRPAAADRTGDPGHPRQGHLPADLLSRELRRCGAERRRHRRGSHRQGQGRGRHRHAFQHGQPERGLAQGDAARQGAWRQGRARHRLPPGPLGPDRPRPGRGALRRQRRGDRPPAAHPARVRSHRRHRGGDPHRRRQHRHHGGDPRGPGGRARSA